ncbi:MAG TPA: 4Fe-4S binding protein, partial [Phycisphaerae bacterium]|nr:4Fe-4S binding protein [Phycisphaerae bacterium]
MIISIASGKGGTGKTMVATNLAAVLPGCALVDCDVEEPNCHLFINPQIDRREKAMAEVPAVDQAACDNCGKCAEQCRFRAIASTGKRLIIFPELCHSCGLCYKICPRSALKPSFHELGEIRTGAFRDGHAFADALLKIGEVRSAEVIRRLTSRRMLAATVVRDCPPGTSCSMVASVKGSSIAVLVTEPTPFGLHDLQAAVETLEHMGIPHAVIINRSDIGFADTEQYCREKGIPVIARIPYSQEIAQIVSAGKLLVDHGDGYRRVFTEIAEHIQSGESRTVKADLALRPHGDGPAVDLFERCKDRTPANGLRTVAIISGKGGTGKTTLAGSFAALMQGKITVDCDVDAANLHLLMKPDVQSTGYFRSSYVAKIDAAKCSGCGLCAKACRFNAISMQPRAEVDEPACEGCGMCLFVCPLAQFDDENPVRIVERIDGEAYRSQSRFGGFIHAKMYPGGEASGKLVTLLRGLAEEQAGSNGAHSILIDSSPGVGCPVNASILSADLAVAVTEPSVSALHDLERALRLTHFFGIPTRVVINKVDLNPDVVIAIRDLCERLEIEIVGEIPFDPKIV